MAENTFFLIEGDAKTVYTAFGQSNLVASEAKRSLIRIDVDRTRFFGTLVECLHHRRVWLSRQSSNRNYAQGNMSAGNLFLLFGSLPLPFFKGRDTSSEEAKADVVRNTESICFAYVDENQDLHGLLLHYRKDDPTKWILGLSKNPHLEPGKVDIKVLTSFDPRPFCQSSCRIASGEATKGQFINAMASPRLAKFIQHIITPAGQIHPSAKIIKWFLQNAVSESNFVVNDELLAFFDEHMPEILASHGLRLLLDHEMQPSLAQMQRCLDPESELYGLLSAFTPTDNVRTNKAQLATLLFLDKHGLNERQEAIRGDNVLVEKLHDLPSECGESVALFLREPSKTNVLRFLMANDHCSDLVLQFGQINDPQIWQKFAVLTEWAWQFPADAYRHAVLCKLLLNAPSISEQMIHSVYNYLDPNNLSAVASVFEPFPLANYISTKPEECLELLTQANEFFLEILPKYQQTARLMDQSLSPQLKSALTDCYVKNPSDVLLPSLHYCHNADQIKAGYILHELGFVNLPVYLLNPAVVSAVNLLKSFNLTHCIKNVLEEELLLVGIGEIHKIENETFKKASLILLSQQALNAEEFRQLLAAFRAYPQLAYLTTLAHEKNCSAQQIKELVFSPNRHHAARALVALNVKFEFNQLKPFTCQFLLMIADLVTTEQSKDLLADYLKSVLPEILRFLNDEISWEAVEKAVLEQHALFVEEDEATVQQATRLILQQLNAYRIAQRHQIPVEKQMTKSKQHTMELGLVIELVSVKLKEKAVPEAQKQSLYDQVFSFFSSLDADKELASSPIPPAIEALISCHLQSPETPLVSFDALLHDSTLANAILALEKQELPAQSLLTLEEPLRNAVSAALVKLSQVSPNDRQAFNLAMQNDSDGHDFRFLLTRMKAAHQPPPQLVTFLYQGIQSRRIRPEGELIEKSFSKQRVKTQAFDLDERLIMINRLRALGFDNQVVAFMMKNDEKSRQFYKAVLRVEAECQTIRSRLSVEASEKYEQLKPCEPRYRRDLYTALYEAFNPGEPMEPEKALNELTRKIHQAAKHITDIVEIDRHPEVRIAMMVIVNLLTLVFTATIANWVHQKNTGDFLFFYRPASSEALNGLNKQVLEETATAIMTPAGG